MKTIGLIGGTSWESTLDYYRYLNQETKRRQGKRHSARIVMYSIDFQDVEDLITEGRMPDVVNILTDAAKRIERAGADCLMIGANTMHMFADEVKASVNIPLIHIVEATLKQVVEKGIYKIGLLGTRPTMEMDFYKNVFAANGVEVLTPDEKSRIFIQEVIFQELFSGVIKEESRSEILQIIDGMVKQGASGVILGCTELPLLIKQDHTLVPLFDSTFIHAAAAVDFAV